MNRTSQRLVAALCVVGLASGCAVTRGQRQAAVYTSAAATAVAAAVALHYQFATCPPGINGASERCEADLIDNRNTAAGVALGLLVVTIGAQLLPVTDEAPPRPSAVVMAPPPPPPAAANDLHDPAAVALAQRARELAAAGKCVEAFGSLAALARIDREMADQLRAWDPRVSRCRRASVASETAVPSVAPTTEAAAAGPGALPAP
ncbi:MAG: hypothetical protein R3B06_02035 [Kofleriaceae bacterium]